MYTLLVKYQFKCLRNLRCNKFLGFNARCALRLTCIFSFQDLFVPFSIKTMEELTLGANLPLADLKRLQWKTKDYTTGKHFPLCIHVLLKLVHVYVPVDVF